jgi:hypothetical protein
LNMRKLAVAAVLCGVGLLVYGLLSFRAAGSNPDMLSGWVIAYDVVPRLEAAIGAVLFAAGWLLWKSK